MMIFEHVRNWRCGKWCCLQLFRSLPWNIKLAGSTSSWKFFYFFFFLIRLMMFLWFKRYFYYVIPLNILLVSFSLMLTEEKILSCMNWLQYCTTLDLWFYFDFLRIIIYVYSFTKILWILFTYDDDIDFSKIVF